MVAALNLVRTRARTRVLLQAVAIAGAVFAIILLVSANMIAAAVTALAIGIVQCARRWVLDATAAAHLIESASEALDNLLVTAVEIEQTSRQVRPEIRDEIERQLHQRLGVVNAAAIVPLAQPAAIAVMIVVGCGMLAAAHQRLPPAPMARQSAAGSEAGDRAADMQLHVTPPAYSGRAAETFVNPLQVTVLAGTSLRASAGRTVLREWVATESTSLELRPEAGAAARFLLVLVVPDAPPAVRVVQPGRDLAFARADGSVAIQLDARDDLGLDGLALRYTKATGGGENLTFVEGEVPLDVERVSDRLWTARARWSLDGLALADGDVLVYRAVARDTNPAGVPVQSESFLIEIGRTAEIASAGFALPSEERKYAISQQMVIYKTERLIQQRRAHATDWLEQTRMIAMEQRMVRAEVVFLGGGEVEDEVEEAAHSHELAEGRLANPGRAEMLRAINFMSRAEAQLNDGRAEEALVLERQALASLERALDRRRYFLRTLPDRSRIDGSRRLSGDRTEARSWSRATADASAGRPIARHRSAMRSLAQAAAGARKVDASLAAEIAAVDPASTDLQAAAVTLAAAESAEDRHAAVRDAMDALTAHALRLLAAPVAVRIPADPLAGLLGAGARSPR